MKSENGIKNRWELLESVLGIADLKHKFNAYAWYVDENFRISKEEYWSGWWNDIYNFLTIYPKNYHGKLILQSVKEAFEKNGYTVTSAINNGISIMYATMTQKESDEKARRNLLNGGRMSD